MSAAASDTASSALGNLGDAANQLLSRHRPEATALALACLEAASALADAGVEPAAASQLEAVEAIRQAASLLQLDPRDELRNIGSMLSDALNRGA